MSASDDIRLGGRVPAVLRIRLKYADVDTFIEKFSVNLSRGGLFIASKTPQPVGTALKFEFQLSQGTPVVRGEGEVIWVKQFDPAAPQKPVGMGVRFTRLDADSKGVIERALQWKEKTKAALAAIEAKAAGAQAAAPATAPPPVAPPTPPTPPVDTASLRVSAIHAMGDQPERLDSIGMVAAILSPLAAATGAPVGEPVPASSSAVAAASGDLDQMCSEWGITPERIAATIDRVRAERHATDGDELEGLAPATSAP